MRRRRKRAVAVGATVVASAIVGLIMVLAAMAAQTDSLPPLSTRAVADYVRSADNLAQRYVDQSWCQPMLAGSVGTLPRWPSRLATAREAKTLVAGPPRGRVTGGESGLLDVSDVRAVLPPTGHAWVLRPGFCVSQDAYPRLVTAGGRSRPSYPPLPRRLRNLGQIFDRFPQYLGRVTGVAVPVTVEVSYALAVDGGAARPFHLWWVTTLGMVPAGPGAALRLQAWALGAPGAYVTVRHDQPLGPEVVHPLAPESGP
jgi:hypothetical protein